ncbi:MAG: NosD domain-containing protein [Chloroflexales bacterium]
MRSRSRHLSLVVLLALLIASLPTALPAHAAPPLSLVVNSINDGADATINGICETATAGECTLRAAIEEANANSGPDTITFTISGTAPFTITPTSPLPVLSGGGDTTISVSAAHTVVIDGTALASGMRYGLMIMSPRNIIRGLVIVGVPGSTASTGGCGIALWGANAHDNVIANNWIGINADGTSAYGSDFYGVLIDDSAHDNVIGGTTAGDGNVIAGNLHANIAVTAASGTTSTNILNNKIIGNFIGTNAAGTAVPTGLSDNALEAGVLVGYYAYNTLIQDNLIGGIGIASTSISPAGIVLQSHSTLFEKHPHNTTIVGNNIGVTSSGIAIRNYFGIRVIGSAISTTIGNPTDLAGGRNVIGNSQDSGIVLDDITISTDVISDTLIVGNSIGIARDGITLAPIGTVNTSTDNAGIYLGTQTGGIPTTIGPGNVIAAIRRYGIHVRSGGNVIKGNFIGTNPAGMLTGTTVSSYTTTDALGFGTGGAGIWVENGIGNTIGGSASADRNVIAIGGNAASVASAAIALRPDVTACVTPCVVSNTTIQGNYLGVKASGDAALASPVGASTEGLRLSSTSGNTVRGNVISGAGNGIILRNSANTNTIIANKIGTGSSGSLAAANAIGNTQNGISIILGAANQITSNIIANNGSSSTTFSEYHGINIANAAVGVNDGNIITGNNLVNNGIHSNNTPGGGSGIFINGATGILITKSTTSSNKLDGITFGTAGSNGGMASPALSTFPSGAVSPVLSGSASGCGLGCTIEVFTSPTSDTKEGPIYLTSGTTTDSSGNFSIPVPGCQLWLTATVRAASGGNTSPFSTELDASTNTACKAPTITLTAAIPNSNSIALGSSTTYTHQLTNGDAVSRDYTVVIISSRGWASGPSTVTVAAGATVALNVVVSPPLGATTATPDITTVQVYLGSFGSSVQTDTTTATQPSLATPAVSPGQTISRADPTASVTFIHSVTNTGSLAGTFAVVSASGSGVPSFVGTPPSGWTIASATLAQSSLSGGASTTLTVVVNTPPGAPTPAGDVQLSFGIKETTNNALVTATDTITVPVVRAFTFVATNPTGAPPTLSRPPGASADFVYTVTNTGNASDTFHVTAPTDAVPLTFTISPSSDFSLAAGAARTVTLTAQVAAGNTPIGNYDFTVSAQAVGGTGIPTVPTVAGRVAVVGGGSPQLTFGVSTPSSVGAAGGTLDFTGTLTNMGNVAVPFTLGTPAVTGGPTGWLATVINNTCPTTPSTLGIGANCTFTLRVAVPAGANGGPQAASISATADNSGQTSPVNVTVSAAVTANVDIVHDVSLSVASPSGIQAGDPGTVLTYTHTLTNIGNAPDSFSISFTPTAPASAAMAVLTSDSLINVPRNGTRTVTLVVTVPHGVVAGDLHFSVTASATGATASQDDIARINPVDAAQISPGTSQNGLPGIILIFSHTITNTGSTVIAYDIAATDSQAGFTHSVTGSPTAILNPGQTATISVHVTMPAGLASGTSNFTTVEVRKAGATAPILASATDTSRAGKSYDVTISPDRSGVGYPKTTLVFTHTVTNVGINADTYIIAATNSLFWPEGASPDLFTLASGASQVITVMIDVPNDNSTLAGVINLGRVQVASKTNPSESHGEVVEHISIGQTAMIDFSTDQARVVTPRSGRIRMSDLVLKNNGNKSDIFDFSVLGADNGWLVTLDPFTSVDARTTNYNVTVWVTVPSNVESGLTKTITIQVRSRYDQSVVDAVSLRFVYIAPAVMKVTYRLFLPVVQQ